MKKDIFLQIVRSKAKTALTPEEENMFGSIGEAVERAFNEDAVTRAASIKEITDKLGSVEEGETLSGIIRGLASKVDEMEAKAKRTFSNDEKYKLRSMLESKKDEILRARKSGAPWEIEFRAKRAASAMMTQSTVLTGATAHNTTNIFEDLDVVVIQYPKNFILDAINSRETSVNAVGAVWRWKEETTAGTGVPAVVTEGNAKPLVDKKFVWKYAELKKYAGRIEMTEEVEINLEQLTLDIINMFEMDVIRAWQDGVLADIIAWAPAYVSTSLDGTIVKPTVYSVIGAGKLAVQKANYEPDIVIMSPDDAAEAIYLQDNNGAQQFIPADLQFGGLQAFISNKVDAGTILVGTRATVQERHSGFIIRKGTYGNQFIENEATIVGEVFSIMKLPTLSAYSWCKLDVATVKAALLKPAVN